MFVLYRFVNLLRRLLFRVFVAPFFGSFGKHAALLRPRGVEGISRIFIGNNVYIADACLLAAVPYTQTSVCKLQISDGCKIGAANHIYATRSVVLEPKVLTAGNVYISDNLHAFSDIDQAVMDQPITQLKEVRIGKGSWLGQNVCVIGASVGQGSVIGANSVVLSDIPDFCVAVGSPARVVKRYDFNTRTWLRPAED